MADENVVVTKNGVQFGWTVIATSVLLAGGFYISGVLSPIELRLIGLEKEQNNVTLESSAIDARVDELSSSFSKHAIEAAKMSTQLISLRRDYDKLIQQAP